MWQLHGTQAVTESVHVRGLISKYVMGCLLLNEFNLSGWNHLDIIVFGLKLLNNDIFVWLVVGTHVCPDRWILAGGRTIVFNLWGQHSLMKWPPWYFQNGLGIENERWRGKEPVHLMLWPNGSVYFWTTISFIFLSFLIIFLLFDYSLDYLLFSSLISQNGE